jgi:hypothetical protein
MLAVWRSTDLRRGELLFIGHEVRWATALSLSCANTGESDPTQMDTKRTKEPDRRDERGGFEREGRT